ncbi:MAG TPA: PAS domain-containing protein [Flavobacterium sp.]|jgi:hypothetical protein
MELPQGTLSNHDTAKASPDALNFDQFQLQSLIEGAPYPIGLYMGKDMVIQLANKAMLDAWGKGSDVVRKTYQEALPELHNQGVYEQLHQVYTTGEPFHAKNQPIDLLIDGVLTTRYFNYSFTAFRDKNNIIIGVMNTGADVTDLNVANRKIQESEYQIRQLIHESPIATCLFLGPEMKIELLNESMIKLWGKGESVIGKTIREALPELEGQPFFDHFDEVYRTGITHSATGAEAKLVVGGVLSTFYFDYTYKALRNENGEIYGIIEVAVDVTEQVLGRKMLEANERKFKNLVIHAPVGICIVHKEPLMAEIVNEKFLEIVGKSREEMESRPYWEVNSEAAEMYEPILRNVYESGIPYQADAHKITLVRHGVPEDLDINFVYEPLRDDSGEVTSVMILAIDVTYQISARDKIQQSEQRFRSLIASAPIGIGVFVGRDLVIETHNQTFVEIVGKEYEIRGLTLRDAMPELVTENQPFLKILDDVYTTGIPYQSFGTQVMIKKGEVMTSNFYDITYTPMFDSEGKVYAILDIAIDVTENVLAHKKIEESEQNLRNTILQAPVAMCILRGENHVVEIANERMLELWGKDAATSINKPLFEGLPEVKGQGFEELLEKVYTTGKTFHAFEQPLSVPRGDRMELIYVNFVYEAFYEADGAISGVMAVAIDVTDQVLSRRKIEEAEEKARLAIESAELGTYETNLHTDLLKTSDRFNEIWSIDKADVVSRSMIVDKIHPEDIEIRNQAHKIALITGNLHYETRIIVDNGAIKWIRAKGKIVYDDKGEPETLLGIIQDITEQKEFAEQLTKQVNERTTELHRSNDDLLQFAHVASHDLKEPVRKIKFFSSMLEDEFGELLPQRGRTCLTKVQAATDRMFSMIEGVLSYSTVSSSDQQIKVVDLNEVLASIESDLEVVITQKHVNITSDALPKIEGASVLLYQLFYNIINNALKFSRPDVAPRIHIAADFVVKNNISYAQISITDNGIGLDPDYTDRIFNAFARLHSKDKYEGTGLGLALCKKIVERHDGSISATGVRNESATFTITLPLKQPKNYI